MLKSKTSHPFCEPPRSSDLTPAEYYLWSHPKDTVSGKSVNKLDEFWFLVELTAAVRHLPGIYHPFGNYWRHSVQLRLQTEGDHF